MAKQKGRITRNQKISAANEAALQQLRAQAAGAEQPQVTGDITVVVSAETNDGNVISSSALFKEGPYMESSVFQTQKPIQDTVNQETETVQSPDQQQPQAKPDPVDASADATDSTAPSADAATAAESVETAEKAEEAIKAAKKAAKAAKKAAKEAAEKAEEAIKAAKKAAKRSKRMPSEITSLRLEPIIARAMMFA